MSEVALRASGLGKCFKLYQSPRDRAIEWLTGGLSTRHEDFWAIRDVSFEVPRGQNLAVIGPNGAGKTTLLRLLTGSLTPTTGHYEARGRVYSLLELGSGFNPELTGRRNLLRAAQLLNLSSSYLHDKLQDIEQFAELGEHFDRPLKFYSTGMKARLGFALVAFLEPDVLIVDEVLAVGDIFFQQKCHRHLRSMMARGATVVFVTHSLSQLPEFFERAMVLHRGHMAFLGPVVEAMEHFRSLLPLTGTWPLKPSDPAQAHTGGSPEPRTTSDDPLPWPAPAAFLDLSRAHRRGGVHARCVHAALCNSTQQSCHVFEQGSWVHLFAEFEVLADIGIPIAGVQLLNERGTLVHGKTTVQELWPAPGAVARQGARVLIHRAVKLDLSPGQYTINLDLCGIAAELYPGLATLTQEEIVERSTALAAVDRLAALTVTHRSGSGLSLLHHGICDLPSSEEVVVLSSETPVAVAPGTAQPIRAAPTVIRPTDADEADV